MFKYVMVEVDLLVQFELSKVLLEDLLYLDCVILILLDLVVIVVYGEQMGWICCVMYLLGDVLVVDDEQVVLFFYFCNNVLYFIVIVVWVVSCFFNNWCMLCSLVIWLGKIIYLFIQGELFLLWDSEGFGQQLQVMIDFFVCCGLFEFIGEGWVFECGLGQDDVVYQLKVIGCSLI